MGERLRFGLRAIDLTSGLRAQRNSERVGVTESLIFIKGKRWARVEYRSLVIV